MQTDDLKLLSTAIARFLTAHEKWCKKHCPIYGKELGYETSYFSLRINNVELNLEDLKRLKEVEETLLKINPTATEFANQAAWIPIQDEKFGTEIRSNIQQQISLFWAETAAAQRQR